MDISEVGVAVVVVEGASMHDEASTGVEVDEFWCESVAEGSGAARDDLVGPDSKATPIAKSVAVSFGVFVMFGTIGQVV